MRELAQSLAVYAEKLIALHPELREVRLLLVACRLADEDTVEHAMVCNAELPLALSALQISAERLIESGGGVFDATEH